MRKILIITGIFLIFSVSFALTMAQTTTQNSEIIITWQANNFYPSNYPNKAPVTRNSEVFVALELIENNRMVNLSENNITWYLDGTFLIRGVGVDEISFESKKLAGDSHKVRAIIQKENSTVEKTITIPVKNYEAIIEAPLDNLAVRLGSSLSLKSFPYFFNIESIEGLTFNWIVNGEKKTGITNEISLNVGGNPSLIGSRILINSTIINKSNSTESVKATKNFTIIN